MSSSPSIQEESTSGSSVQPTASLATTYDLDLDLDDTKFSKTSLNEIQSSIFNQISHISEFLAENAEMGRSDPCFQMLNSFFDIFNQQLKINFKLRNKLNSERSRNPVDPKRVDQLKSQIDNFLKSFNQLINSDNNNQNNDNDNDNDDDGNDEKQNIVITNLGQIEPFLSKMVKKSEQLKILNKNISKLKKIISNLNEEVSEEEKRMEAEENEIETEKKSIIENISLTESRIEGLKKQIEEITPIVMKLRSHVESETKVRENLSEMIFKRKENIEMNRQKFAVEVKKQKKKKEKLAKILAKLKIEKRHLMLEEQPLISALEEAENELRTIQKMSKSEIDSISQQKAEIEGKIMKIKEEIINTQQQKEVVLQKLQEKKDEASESSLKTNEINEKMKILNMKIEKIKEGIKNKHMSNESESEEEQLSIYSEQIQQLTDIVEEKKLAIEESRKENSIIRSKIRVNQEKITELSESNQKLRVSIEMDQKENDKLRSEANSQKLRYKLFQSTMTEYTKMRHGLGFHSSLSPAEVAKHTISMIRSWKLIENNEENGRMINEKVSLDSINADFDNICEQIDQVQARLSQ